MWNLQVSPRFPAVESREKPVTENKHPLYETLTKHHYIIHKSVQLEERESA